MKNFQRLFDHPNWLSFVVLIALHVAAVQVSFICGKTLENEVIIWLPNSVLLVALLRFNLKSGLLMSVLTLCSNVIGNLPSAPFSEAVLLSAVNLIEVWLIYTILYLTRTSPNLVRLKDFTNFILAGPIVGAFVSGLLGALVITAYGAPSSYLTLMRVWWFDDGLGLLIFAPILMLASTTHQKESPWRLIDALFVLIIVLLLAAIYTTQKMGYTSLPLTPTFIIPFALMLSLRFKIIWTAIGVALISLAVSSLVAVGLNPFGDTDLNHLIIHTQEFILSISIICMGSSIFVNQLQLHERELERKVAARTAELADNLKHLKTIQDELIHSAKLASLGTLVAGVAHELNTPIGITIMAASTLRQHVLQLTDLVENKKLKRSELEDFVSNLLEETNLIERNITRASNLVASFKQISVDQTSEHLRSFDLLQIVTENLITLLPVISKNNLGLQIDIPESIQLESYPGPLGQVITSLVNNILTHAFAGKSDDPVRGQIVIRAHRQNQQATIEIIDDGIGMNGATAARVFDPFFTTRMGTGSSGLGLYIVNNIVTGILGGSIALATQPQQGTQVKIILPLNAPGG